MEIKLHIYFVHIKKHVHVQVRTLKNTSEENNASHEEAYKSPERVRQHLQSAPSQPYKNRFQWCTQITTGLFLEVFTLFLHNPDRSLEADAWSMRRGHKRKTKIYTLWAVTLNITSPWLIRKIINREKHLVSLYINWCCYKIWEWLTKLHLYQAELDLFFPPTFLKTQYIPQQYSAPCWKSRVKAQLGWSASQQRCLVTTFMRILCTTSHCNFQFTALKKYDNYVWCLHDKYFRSKLIWKSR